MITKILLKTYLIIKKKSFTLVDRLYHLIIQKKKVKYFKHSSIISFTKKALDKFCKLKQSPLELAEGVELSRAIENNFRIGTFILNDKSFSVDVNYDLLKAIKRIKLDKIRRRY